MITVAGNLEDIFGASAAGAQMFVQLCGYGARIPRATGAVIADTSPLQVAVSGAGAYSFQVVGNDTIDPSGTYYTVQVRNARNGTVQTNAYNFTGAGPYDLSSAAVLANPDGALPPLATGYGSLVVQVPFSATPAFVTLGTPSVEFEMTLTGAVTSSTLPVTVPGQLVSFRITQGPGGPYPFAYPPQCKGGMGVSSVAGGISVVTYETGSDGNLYPITVTVAVGTTTTAAAGSSASVVNAGTSSAVVLNFTVPAGATGAMGTPGTTGAAATVAVGTTTTGAAGTSASVTNSGSSAAAVLNFTVPTGATGAMGTTGATGPGVPSATAAGQFVVSTATGVAYAARALNTSDLAALGAFPIAGGTITGATTFNAAATFNYQATFYSSVQIGPSGGSSFTVTGPTLLNGTVYVNGYPVTGSGYVTVTYSATPTYNGANGTSFLLSLTGAVTGGSLSNLAPGSLYVIQINQGATAYAYAWPTGLSNTTPVIPQANKTVYQLIFATSPSSAVAVAPLATP